MNTDICDKDHSNILSTLEELPISQAPSRGRHHCPGCAYEEGYQAELYTLQMQFSLRFWAGNCLMLAQQLNQRKYYGIKKHQR